MGIVVEAVFRPGNPHHAHELDRPFTGRSVVHLHMQPEHLGQLLADGEDRVERGHRLLEDHGDLPAPDGSDLGAVLAELEQVSTFEDDLAAHDLAGGADELHDRQLGDRLPTSALPYHADDLVLVDVVGDAVDGSHGADLGPEMSHQIVDSQ